MSADAIAMTVLSEQETGQVNDLASRLRRIQMDAATAPEEKRRDLLQEELARSLKGVPPASRKGYLKVLLARFPVAGRIVQTRGRSDIASADAGGVAGPFFGGCRRHS